MTKRRCHYSILLALLALAGCFFEEESGDHAAPLTKAQVHGCWMELDTSDFIVERCFDSSSMKLYILLRHPMEYPGAGFRFSEDSGSWKLRGEEIHYRYFYNPGRMIRDSSSTSRPYRFSGDTLYDLYNPGRVGATMARSTATRNLRPHWRYFNKPVDWTLD